MLLVIRRAYQVREGMISRTTLLLLLLSCAACATESAPALETSSSELVTAANPVNHGALAFGASYSATLTSAEGYHAWHFSLAQNADLTFTTAPVAGGPAVDTVLALYRQQTNGSWGTAVASNNNGPTPPWSRLVRSLTPGSYRILVRGALKSTVGPFSVSGACSGAGCTCPNPQPLSLNPEDPSALDPAIATFNAGARNGGDWCSLTAPAWLYSLPVCLAQPATLESVVTEVIAQSQDLGGYFFSDGTVLTAAEIQQSLPFSTSCSAGGPGVAQAVSANVSGTTPQGWVITSEVPCHNCHEFNHYMVLLYPDGNVLVLPYVTGYDS